MRRTLIALALAEACAAPALTGCEQILGNVGGAQCDACDAGGDGSLSDDNDDSAIGVGDMDASEATRSSEDEYEDVYVEGEGESDVWDADAADVVDAPEGAADVTDAPSTVDEQEAGCTSGATRCDDTGAILQVCQDDGGWQNRPCPAFCELGECNVPPSCSEGGDVSICGSSSNESCCESRAVPGGTFYRSYDGLTDNGLQYGQDYPATVSPFELDVFEVTVSRFRNFVGAYDNGASPPLPGSGRDPNDPSDNGWAPAWASNLQGKAINLEAELACSSNGNLGTWTEAPGPNELLPITCVDWYTAFAFCVWDGGRLATEAEWNFAAAGASEQRVYPWSSPGSQAIDSTDAVYGVEAPLPVGSTTSGVGKWGQFDLGGNADEWVRDWYADPYPAPPCVNCANFTPGTVAVLRGGTYIYNSDLVSASFRDATVPGASGVSPYAGIRCARDSDVVNDE
jgi:sulfatase modifying factor 1